MFADSKVFFLASAQNSEGKRIVSPCISFAEDMCKSSRYDTLMPRRTVGSVSLQRSSARHLIAAFNWKWKRNTMPFAARLYAVVLIFRVSIISFTQRKSCDLKPAQIDGDEDRCAKSSYPAATNVLATVSASMFSITFSGMC